MMRKLLESITEGVPMTASEPGAALGARLPEVEAMIGELTRLGCLGISPAVRTPGAAAGSSAFLYDRREL